MTEETKSTNEAALAVLRKDDDAWLKTLYVETWKQYSHEDALVQARSNVFLLIQAALVAFLAATTGTVGKIGCATFTCGTVNLGLAFLGAIWVAASVLLLLLGRRFDKVTEAGKLYVNLRHLNLRALERLAGVRRFGPALLEHAWREFQPTDLSSRFRPFADNPELLSYQDLSIGGYSHFGGITYLREVANIWRTVYRIVLVIGLILLAIGLFGPALSLHTFIPTLGCV